MVSLANFAERIKELRTETGLTQEQLAEKAGATRIFIHD
jgi:transcriptional regulator with XRE-family HTH domain